MGEGIVVNFVMFAGAAIAVGWFVMVLWRLLRTTGNFLITQLTMLWSWITSIVATCLVTLFKPFEAIGTIWFFVLRGRLTVRAAGYLLGVEDGMSQEDANRFALSIDTFAASKRKHEVMHCVQQVFGGSQLALISEARLKGFRG